MPDATVTNWFGDITSHPKVVAEANSVDDIVAILRNPGQYPSPVRAVGSNHSTAACGIADGGTLIRMGRMNRILEIAQDTVTAEAGALYIDVAEELLKHGLQFHVNTEIGNLSIGSAACCGTKDSSMPGEFGQVGSYVTRLKMILPSGDLLEVVEADADLMQKVRSSYGTFGIVVEATFQVRPVQPMAVHHETFELEDFISKYPSLKARGDSMMYYIFPFDNKITVEFRRYDPKATGDPDDHVWPLRNYLWATAGPAVCAQVEREMHNREIRNRVLDGFNALWRFKLEHLVKSGNTVATGQIIRYPAVAGASKYTFSLWAHPEPIFTETLRACFEFCRKYDKDHQYRINMLFVGYSIAQDRNSLLSYSYDGPVSTMDPVSTANPGWQAFLSAYNQFCSERSGIPLFNQTPGLTREQVQKALGSRLTAFAEARKTYDPGNRLLNTYFQELLA
jgi:FAD/FMN-containing dehydrogenase